nr:hypothetical protein [Petrotoga sp. SL27]
MNSNNNHRGHDDSRHDSNGHDHGGMIADFQKRFWVSLVLTIPILALSRATYRKMVQNLLWATGYNAIALTLAAGVGYVWGILLSPAIGAAFMSLSTIIVAINAKLLERARKLVPGATKDVVK